jgi:hypothetical protein
MKFLPLISLAITLASAAVLREVDLSLDQDAPMEVPHRELTVGVCATSPLKVQTCAVRAPRDIVFIVDASQSLDPAR